MRLRPLALVALLSVLVACGGGGGGGGGGPTCVLPGILRALAVQGEPAPGTAGDFGIFSTSMLLDVAASGFAVFVAPTTDATKPNVLYVALANGTLREVYAEGEVVPDAAGGTISGFGPAIDVTSDGRITVRVGIVGDGGGRTFGLLSARVSGTTVVEKHDVIYSGRDMAPTGVAGTLTTLLDVHVASDGTAFFRGSTSAGLDGFWAAEPDGTNLVKLVAEGDALPGALTVEDVTVTGIDAIGSRFAFTADVVGTTLDGLWSAAVGSATFSELAFEGDALPGGGTIGAIHEGGVLIVYASGAVVWNALDDTASPNDALLLGAPGVLFTVLARSGDPAPGTGGGTYGNLRLLNAAPDATSPMFLADIDGVSPNNDHAVYALTSVGTVFVLVEGQPAPGSAGGGFFGDTFPGLAAAGRTEVSVDGTLLVGNLLSTGTSGLFWIFPCGPLTLAAQNGPAPGGDTFGAFSPSSAHAVATNVAIFRATLSTAGTGVFRQGP